MMKLSSQIMLSVVVLLVLAQPALNEAASDAYIRVNQVGFLPTDPKQAIVFSSRDLRNVELQVIDVRDGEIVFQESLKNSKQEMGDQLDQLAILAVFDPLPAYRELGFDKLLTLAILGSGHLGWVG